MLIPQIVYTNGLYSYAELTCDPIILVAAAAYSEYYLNLRSYQKYCVHVNIVYPHHFQWLF